MELKIENLTIDEANIIMKAVGKLPYDTVFRLMNKIRSGFDAQLADNPDVAIVEEHQ